MRLVHTSNGVTLVTDEDDRETLDEFDVDGDVSDIQVLENLMESFHCNGGPFLTNSDTLHEAGWCCLTSSPLIIDDLSHSDAGQLTASGNLYWLPGYETRNMATGLRDKGEIFFALA